MEIIGIGKIILNVLQMSKFPKMFTFSKKKSKIFKMFKNSKSVIPPRGITHKTYYD